MKPEQIGSLNSRLPPIEQDLQVRMDKLQAAPADSARAQKVRASFDTLLGRLGLGLKVELRVVRGDVLAEALHGDVVIVNEAIGAWPEQERLFVLAHELGHVALGHWSQMSGMYQKWVPGRVTQAQTDAVAALLGREASALALQPFPKQVRSGSSSSPTATRTWATRCRRFCKRDRWASRLISFRSAPSAGTMFRCKSLVSPAA